MHNFSYSLSGFLKDLKRKSADNLNYSSVVDLWSEIVGERTSKNTRAMYLKEGILYVEVFSSVWLNEIKFIKDDIIDKYNEKFKKNILIDINFSIKKGAFDDRSKTTFNKPKKEEFKIEENQINDIDIIKQLTANDLSYIEYQISKFKINDEKVLKKLKDYLITSRLREINLLKAGYKRCEKCKNFYKEETGCLPCSFRDSNDLRNSMPLDS